MGRLRNLEKRRHTARCEVCGGAYAATPGKRSRFCSAGCRRRYGRVVRVAEWRLLRARLDQLMRVR